MTPKQVSVCILSLLFVGARQLQALELCHYQIKSDKIISNLRQSEFDLLIVRLDVKSTSS